MSLRNMTKRLSFPILASLFAPLMATTPAPVSDSRSYTIIMRLPTPTSQLGIRAITVAASMTANWWLVQRVAAGTMMIGQLVCMLVVRRTRRG